MGGMIAVKMAEILESERGGEEVAGVILMDSANPEGYPAFEDTDERDEVAEWTYNAYAGRSGLPSLDDSDCCSSDDDDDLQQRREDDRDSGLGDDSDDEEVDVMEYLPRMRSHIYNSLDMIADAGAGGSIPHDLKSPVRLVKCTQLAALPDAMSQERKDGIQLRFRDERAGWTMEDFKSIPLEAQHDDVFDGEHVGDVTDILRDVLGEMR